MRGGLSVQAASFDAAELQTLRNLAAQDGAVPVMVHLQNTTLTQLRDAVATKQAVDAASAKVLAEMGKEAWPMGRWSNGVGQIVLHVTPKGLEILRNSKNALRVFSNADATDSALNGSSSAPGSIGQLIPVSGWAALPGTSQAAPHIAGLYTVAKSANPNLTVDGISQWFISNAAQNVTINPGAPGAYTVPRIRLPAL